MAHGHTQKDVNDMLISLVKLARKQSTDRSYFSDDEIEYVNQIPEDAVEKFIQDVLHARSWGSTSGKINTEETVLLTQPRTDPEQPCIHSEIREMIQSCTLLIQISMHHFSDKLIFQDLIKKTKEVVVEILLEEKYFKKFTNLFQQNKKYLISCGNILNMHIRIISDHQRETTEQFLIADRRKAIFGLYNYTAFAATINKEQVTVTRDQGIVDGLSKKFWELKRKGKSWNKIELNVYPHPFYTQTGKFASIFPFYNQNGKIFYFNLIHDQTGQFIISPLPFYNERSQIIHWLYHKCNETWQTVFYLETKPANSLQ